MDNTREKLIDILTTAHESYYSKFDPSKTYMDVMADHLIANGVVISKMETTTTNADRIRAMSDDDLAYWIMCPYDSVYCNGIEHNCVECTKEWLQQPAEEE